MGFHRVPIAGIDFVGAGKAGNGAPPVGPGCRASAPASRHVASRFAPAHMPLPLGPLVPAPPMAAVCHQRDGQRLVPR